MNSTKSTIRKAIIPVAGLGTRFLPATKAQPKEMLTLVDKPVIQHVVEEAVAAGIKEIVFVTSQTKRAIEDHFDTSFELETRLRQKGKRDQLKSVQRITRLAHFAFVRQDQPRGDGHAILTAVPFIEPDEPVVVMFGDDVFHAEQPVTAQLIEVYEKYRDPVIALFDVGAENVSSYGIASGLMTERRIMELSGFVEKPARDKAPSSLAAVGRYVVTPEVLARLKKAKVGKDGELRLANAFSDHLAAGRPIYGRVIDGMRYDCGNKLRFLEAAIDFGLRHPEVNGHGEFAELLLAKADELRRQARRAAKPAKRP
jgi:UTP--glucose-1-phosphate uridylyltransferase